MPLNLTNFVRQISKEKDLEPDVIKEAIEQALVAASKKNLSQFKNARASLDLASGQLDLVVMKTIVEKVANPRMEVDLKSARKLKRDVQVGQDIEVVVDPSAFGRIAAQSARQVVMQRLRDAEREKIYAEYKEKVGSVVTGIVQRFERRDAIVNVGRAEGVLSLNQQPFGSHYRIGERLRVLITETEKTQRGPIIRLSRTDPELVIKLFEQEVPEVADGTVKIVAIAREPGVRTKVAVQSSNPDVDPVGACVGMKGSRVQMIVREFENEKIDIVPYTSNPPGFITAALNPAKILSVKVHPESGEADVLVARGNLSLAIGKRGQNARLAARLTGWKINIKGEEETEAQAAAEELRRRYLDDLLKQITELTDAQREAIGRSSYNSVERLAGAEPIAIAALVQGSDELAGQIVSGAQEYLEALAEMTATPAETTTSPQGQSDATPSREESATNQVESDQTSEEPKEGEKPSETDSRSE
jgi:N utilization substance protein A